MSTATAPRQTQHGQARQPVVNERSLLEQIIQLPVGEKVKQMDAALKSRVDEIEALLPDFMKGQGERLIKRARLTFGGSLKLQQCTPGSFIKCVLQAAEFGFAIDGKLCHAVPYNNKKKDDKGKPYWVDEASCQIDYKGMIAVAKRIGVIQDAWARRVHENDLFQWSEENGVAHYHHSFDHKKPRGKVVGVLAVATHKDKWFRIEWMDIEDINRIRGRSKSYESFVDKGYSSPWNTDPGEMEKKTCLKRLLKTFSDDPGLARLLEIDNEDYEDESSATSRPASKAATIDELTTMLNQSSFEPAEVAESVETVEETQEPEPEKQETPKPTAQTPTVDEWSAFKSALEKAVAAKSISDVKTAHKFWYDKLTERRDEINTACDEAEFSIRESRGERSNKKPTQGKLMDTNPTT